MSATVNNLKICIICCVIIKFLNGHHIASESIVPVNTYLDMFVLSYNLLCVVKIKI